jgi:hypothetical protein
MNTSITNSSIVLVHGAFADATSWQPLSQHPNAIGSI